MSRYITVLQLKSATRTDSFVFIGLKIHQQLVWSGAVSFWRCRELLMKMHMILIHTYPFTSYPIIVGENHTFIHHFLKSLWTFELPGTGCPGGCCAPPRSRRSHPSRGCRAVRWCCWPQMNPPRAGPSQQRMSLPNHLPPSGYGYIYIYVYICIYIYLFI